MIEGSRGSRAVGIIGGMGPAATSDLFRKIIDATPATRDQDHLSIVVWDDPRVPDRTEALLGGGADPAPWLESAATHLRDVGCSLIAMPCNTAHAFVEGMAERLGIEIISMITTTARAVATRTPRPAKVGVLATDGTVCSDLYGKAFADEGIEAIYPEPDDQATIMRVIGAVKGGTDGPAERAAASAVIERLRDRGAGATILACTELPLAVDRTEGDEILDPTTLLAQEVVARALRDAS